MSQKLKYKTTLYNRKTLSLNIIFFSFLIDGCSLSYLVKKIYPVKNGLGGIKHSNIFAGTFGKNLASTVIIATLLLVVFLFILMLKHIITLVRNNELLRFQRRYLFIDKKSLPESNGRIGFKFLLSEEIHGRYGKTMPGLLEYFVSYISGSKQFKVYHHDYHNKKTAKKTTDCNRGFAMDYTSYKDSSATKSVVKEISEVNSNGKSLIINELFSSSILDSLSSQIAVINSSGVIIKVNKTWNSFALHNGATTLKNCGEGINYFDICTKGIDAGDSISAKALQGIKEVLLGNLDEFSLEYPCHYKTEKKYFNMRVMRFESDETLAIIEHYDITERKTAEEKTCKAIERYEILSKATSDTIWDWDIIDNRMLYNIGIQKVFCYNESQVENVFEWWKQNIHPDDINKVSALLAAAFEKEVQTVQFDYRFRCANGGYKYIYDRAFVMYDETKKPSRMIGAMQDVTQEKEEERRVEKQHTRLKKIAWIHSHNLRTHVANIMGLAQIFNLNDYSDPVNKKIIDSVNLSACKMDKVIREVTALVSEIREY